MHTVAIKSSEKRLATSELDRWMINGGVRHQTYNFLFQAGSSSNSNLLRLLEQELESDTPRREQFF